MSNKVFLDSSVLVEYRKGTKTEFLDLLLDSPNCELYMSQTVASEYLYYLLAIFGGKAPLSIKMAKEIGATLQKSSPELFLERIQWLPDTQQLFTNAVQLMSNYNLLPNDALILAICHLNQIPAVASYDPDFKNACVGLNITLLQNVSDFKTFIESNN